MAISDEIAVNCAYKARHGEDYPPKIPRIINAESQKRRTPLFSHIHILRWLLPPWLSCLQSLATRFSAPTLHPGGQALEVGVRAATTVGIHVAVVF